ncbi:hypothetical protein Goklo_006739 [Gossypium klotzschianum]|uniref:Uncharacterized protein n=1 Tax=Gossypium klotzschianum TaxID=34286 RepID=A0A7J8VIL1_9ROSI|nr:hypothetical protein [Gossypium klotzschianum]
MEMHKSYRVMRQFEFRQTILLPPQDIGTLYKNWRSIRSACHGLDTTTSHSYYWRKRRALMAAPPPNQYGLAYSGAFTNPIIFTQAPHYEPMHPDFTPSVGMFFAPPPSLAYYTPISTATPMNPPLMYPPLTYPPPPIIPPYYLPSGYVSPYTYTLIVSQSPPASLF